MSVGHLARLLEEGDIPTVTVAVKSFRRCMAVMTLPRLVLTPHLMGRPLGAPGDGGTQRATILAALRLLERAEQAGTIVDLPGVYTPK